MQNGQTKLHLLCRSEHGLCNRMVLGKQVTASIRLLATCFDGFNDKMPYDTRAGFTKNDVSDREDFHMLRIEHASI
jgi:hypothetical protein